MQEDPVTNNEDARRMLLGLPPKTAQPTPPLMPEASGGKGFAKGKDKEKGKDYYPSFAEMLLNQHESAQLADSYARASFLAAVDPNIPWHVSAFYPTYKMTDRLPTPSKTLARAAKIGRDAGLMFVYEGNSPGGGGENTSCPSCGEVIIARYGFAVRENSIVQSSCPVCKASIPGIWQ